MKIDPASIQMPSSLPRSEPVAGAKAPSAADRARAELREAAEGFEAIFLNTLLKTARNASLGEDIMGSSAVDKTRDMYESEVTRIASGRAGLGLADAVVRQFSPYIASKE